jgi:mannose-6-phosphate isomerase-like protein (cupin superfamily)
MKRVVVGHNSEGKSVVLMEGEPNRVSQFPNMPGLRIDEIWATDPQPVVPISGDDPTVTMQTFIAPLGGTRFRMEYYPPEATLAELAAKGEIDFAKAGAEIAAAMPDIAASLEPDNFVMHTTDTIDYNIVLSGELWCELDDGVEVHLQAGDCLVQCGTRHAWHNKSDKPCVKAAIMVGARRT